jgi:hypothetical protein
MEFVHGAISVFFFFFSFRYNLLAYDDVMLYPSSSYTEMSCCDVQERKTDLHLASFFPQWASRLFLKQLLKKSTRSGQQADRS